MKRVIVTGANGFIGSSLIKKLVANNVEVIAIDIFFDNNKIPDNSLIDRIPLDISSVEAVCDLIPNKEYDVFYHLAWQGVNGAQKTDPDVQINNINTTLVCAKVAKKIECKKFLCAGTIAEQAVNSLHSLSEVNGGMMYGMAKHCAHIMLETYCKHIGLEFVWMQFSNIYGPSNKTGNLVSYTINELSQNSKAVFGPARQPYDFIFVDDLIEAVYRLGNINTEKHFYFIGSGEPRILKDYLFEIGDKLKRKDLIIIGERPDDGIKYSFDMFNIKSLKNEIGDYTSKSFSEAIEITINNYH